MEIKLCTSAEDILKCWTVLLELRPHLLQPTFLTTIQQMQQEGYQLAFIEEQGSAVAAIGFRYLQFLYNGKHLYIDDLSTLPSCRGKGYGASLLQYVEALALAKGYQSVTLDSGHQRTTAHRLYLNEGFNIVAHHFSKSLN